jgi:uncharacterized membrane protein YjjP (DUF1212 family)
MKKNFLFIGLGMILSALIAYLLRTFDAPFFQNKLYLTIIIGGLGLLLMIFGMVKKMNKFLLFAGVGAIITALFGVILRTIGLENNIALMIITEVIGVAILTYGLVKGK